MEIQKSPRSYQFYIPLVVFLVISGIILLLIKQGDAVIFINENRQPFWDFFFKYGTYLGDGFMYAILGLLFFFLKDIRSGFLVLFTAFLSTFIGQSLKQLINAPRPKVFFDGIYDLQFIEGVNVHGAFSFPSGHTIAGFSMYCIAWLLIKNRNWGYLFSLMAIVVGVSRIYLCQHFLRDVFVGAIIGVLCAGYIYWLAKRKEFLYHKPWGSKTLGQVLFSK